MLRSHTALAALLLGACLAGCDSPVVRQRAEDIKRHNDALDRKCSTRAAREVRKRWLIEGDFWYGKLPDGTVLKLQAPVFAVEPHHQGKPFYTGWAGDVVLSAVRWETRPPSNNRPVFSIRYRATFKDLEHCTLEIMDGPKAERASASDVFAFEEPGLK